MTDVTSSSDRAVFDELLAEDADRRMHYGALYYAQHGIPVFPISIITDARGKTIKKPGIKGWPSEATISPAVINSWWGSGGTHEGCLIGAVTGARSGWGVIDVDVKNGGRGEESLQRLADELMPLKSTAEFAFGQLLPQERLAPVGLVRTRSGGLHLWYPLGERAKIRGRNKVRGLPNLEFKATGHYVVVAPSDGYEWLKLIPTKDEWDTPVEEYLAGLPAIPEALLERLLDGSGDGDDGPGGDGDEIKIIVQGRGSELLKTAVKTLMSTPDGEGNDTVYKLCCDLYPYVALGEVTKVEVDQAVMAGIRNWGADEGSIKGTMGSAWKRTGERTIKFNTEMIPVSSNGNGPVKSVFASALTRQHQVKNESDDDEPSTAVNGAVDNVFPIKKDTTVEAPTPTPASSSTDQHDPDDADALFKLINDQLPEHLEGTDRTKAVNEVTSMIDHEYKRSIARRLYQELTSSDQSWAEVDLGDDDSDPVPDVLTMINGSGLLYRGEMNMTWGLASAGKSWLAYLAIIQQVKLGRHAILLDYENGRRRIRSRLRMLGLSADEVAEYVHVYLGETGMVPIKRMPIALDQVGIVVTDSCTGALAAMDLDAKSTGDIETFARRNVTPFTEAGAAVLVLDHVTHDADKHDRPINSVHKLNRVQGGAYQVENVVPFTPGGAGWSWIRLWKDNSGGVEQIRGENVGRLTIDATDEKNVRVMIDTDTKSLSVMSQVNKIDDARVEKLIAQLDEVGVDRGLSANKTRAAMATHGISAGQDVVRLAAAARKEAV